jgi:hypothetical protein
LETGYNHILHIRYISMHYQLTLFDWPINVFPGLQSHITKHRVDLSGTLLSVNSPEALVLVALVEPLTVTRYILQRLSDGVGNFTADRMTLRINSRSRKKKNDNKVRQADKFLNIQG